MSSIDGRDRIRSLPHAPQLSNMRPNASRSSAVETNRSPPPDSKRHSFYDLFYSEQQILAGKKPLVDPAAFRDKIVVIGTTAAGLRDLFTVPFAQGSMPGMQVHANVVDNLLSQRFMRPVGAGWNLAALVACALAVGLAGVSLAVWPALGVAALVVLAVGWTAAALFAQGVWVEVAAPLLAVALAAFGGTAYQYVVEGREKRQVTRTFSRFVSRDVYEQLVAQPEAARRRADFRARCEIGCARRRPEVDARPVRRPAGGGPVARAR